MFRKKRRVLRRKRRGKFTKLEALGAVAAAGLIAGLSVLAFHGGSPNHPADALTELPDVPSAHANVATDTQVESLALAATGIDDMTPLLIGGVSLLVLGSAMVRCGRSRGPLDGRTPGAVL